ncbi:unnamed protein product [Allacma fusca]|uniref:Uncharacterized protein n=1 Tax=Allacma fusca TaxID=39272 RepID=A0A8J2KCK2_9HEXA|nr:unnamed protein product [Allacma fusca]
MKCGVFFVISGFVLQTVSSLNCSAIVAIENEGILHYLARVNFPAPFEHKGQWHLTMETDVPYTFLGGWDVWVNASEDAGRAILTSRQEDLHILQNDTISFRFRISWFTNEPKPEVISLTWENATICKTATETGRKVRTVWRHEDNFL